MTFKAGQGGRPKGVKNKKTVARQAVIANAMVGAAAVAVAVKANRPTVVADRVPAVKRKTLTGTLVTRKPRDGMSAKDIMVDAMREAHDAYRDQCIKASEVMERADSMTIQALAIPKKDSETASEHKVRIGEALDVAAKVREQATSIRSEAMASLSLCLDTAHKVAPYDHAKLQTSTIQGEMVLNVTLAKF